MACILPQVEYRKPGRYTVRVPVEAPEKMTLVIGLLNDRGQYFEDAVAVSNRLSD